MICHNICSRFPIPNGIMNVLKNETLFDKFIGNTDKNNLIFQVKGTYIYAMYSKYNQKNKMRPK